MWRFWFICNLDRSIPDQASVRVGSHYQDITLLPNGALVSFSYREATKAELGQETDGPDPFAPTK